MLTDIPLSCLPALCPDRNAPRTEGMTVVTPILAAAAGKNLLGKPSAVCANLEASVKGLHANNSVERQHHDRESWDFARRYRGAPSRGWQSRMSNIPKSCYETSIPLGSFNLSE